MSWIPPTSITTEYEEYNQSTDDDRRFLGEVRGQPDPVMYDPGSRTAHGATIDDGRLVEHDEGDSWDIGPDEDLGEFLERIGEEHGWDSLSSFAREHLEDEQDAAEA